MEEKNMEETKYRAIKYIRLSDADGNLGESDSITNQRRLIDEFIKKHPDIEDVGEKIDDGYSGIIFDRPGFQEMMDLIREGKVNCCITKDLSRLGREYIETGNHLRDLFPKHDCRFIAINDNIDTLTSKGDDLDVTVKMIMNDSYSLDISKKTRSALDSKRNNGEHVGAYTVYGYKKADDNRNKLVIDDHAASIVREIFSMKIDGLSNIRIANILNDRGELPPIRYKREQGLPYAKNGFCDKEEVKWSVSTILRILKDETYTGTLVQGIYSTPNYKIKTIKKKPEKEWKRFENAHEAIINKHTFELTKRVMKLDTRMSRNEDKVRIFSGLVVCGCCGGRMTPKSVPYKDGVRYNYYHCPTTIKGGCKKAAMPKEEDIVTAVLKYCKAHISNLASLDRYLQKAGADKIAREHANLLTVQLKEKEQQLQQMRNAQTTLYPNKVKSLISEDEHKSLKSELAIATDALEKSIEQLTGEIENVLLFNNERLTWIEHFRQFENLSALDRKTVVSLIEYIEIKSKTEFVVHFTFETEYEETLAIMKGCEFDGTKEESSGLLQIT